MRTLPVRRKAFNLLTYIFEQPLRRCERHKADPGMSNYRTCPFFVIVKGREKCGVMNSSINMMIRKTVRCPLTIEEENG